MNTTHSAWLITLGLVMIVTGISLCVTGWTVNAPHPTEECQVIGDDEANL